LTAVDGNRIADRVQEHVCPVGGSGLDDRHRGLVVVDGNPVRVMHDRRVSSACAIAPAGASSFGWSMR
jgi:hypothetical protein